MFAYNQVKIVFFMCRWQYTCILQPWKGYYRISYDEILFEQFILKLYTGNSWISVIRLQVPMNSEIQIRCVKFTSINTNCVISSPIPMFFHLLESSHRDVKHRIWWRNRHYRKKNTHLIWSPWISYTPTILMHGVLK